MVLTSCAPKATPTPTPKPVPTKVPTQAPPTAVPGPKGKVTLWHSWKETEIPALTEVISAFQKKYPDVQFDVLYVPFDDLRGKYETATGTGGGPTVLIGAADWGPALYDAELVADVSKMASEAFLKTINNAALGAVRYKNAVIGLPQTIKGVVLFRNKKIIAQAPVSWEALVSAAKAATAGDVVGADLERGFFFSAAHLNGIGGKLMEASGDPAFDSAEGVEWVNLLKSFSDVGPAEYYTDNDVNLFKAGKAGFIIDGNWNATGLAEAIGVDNLAIDPWPTFGKGNLSGYVQTENIYLNPNSTAGDLNAGWAFMEYFLGGEAQALLTKAGHIPAALGVPVTDPLLQAAMKAFEKGVAFPVIPEMGAYWGAMDTALKSVFDEGSNPEIALKAAAIGIDAKVAELRGTKPPELPTGLKGNVTLWHAWKETEIPALTEVISAFQQRNPDTKFDVLYVPFDDLRGKFETAAGTGSGPTVLIGASDWGPALYDAGLVNNVATMAEGAFLNTINSAALGAVEYKGALIGLPQTIKGVVMFRNKKIIAQAPATWDELVAAAKAATKGDIVGADLERGFFFSAAHLNGIGGQLMNSNGDPAFNTAKGVDWLKLLKSFSDVGPAEYYTDNDVNLFKAGKVGIIIDGNWNGTGLADAIGADNLAIDPWPKYGDGSLSGYVQTENIYLNPNATQQDMSAGWGFMQYFLSPEAQVILTKAGHVPAAVGVTVTDPLLQQAGSAFLKGAVFPVIPEMGSYWGAMDTALKSVFDEGADPAGALKIADDSIVAKIKELRGQ
jgi:maltose-binding protein MalE